MNEKPGVYDDLKARLDALEAYVGLYTAQFLGPSAPPSCAAAGVAGEPGELVSAGG